MFRNSLALALFFTIFVIFLAWLFTLAQQWFFYKKQIIEIKKIKNIYDIKNFLDSKDAKRWKNKTLKVFFERTLLSLEDQKSFDSSYFIKLSRDLLISENIFIKNLIPLFIVIGLFGTILGLILSLNDLNINITALIKSDVINEESLSSILNKFGELIDTLSGAFVPSFFGVLFTILGIIIYNLYNKAACLPFLTALEDFSITLIPNIHSNKYLFTIPEKEENEDNSENKESDISISKKILEANQKITESLVKFTDASDSKFSDVNNMIAVQNNVKELINSLGAYEEKYLLYRNNVDNRNDELYEKTSMLVKELDDNNKRFIDNAVLPLSKKIEDGFIGIADTLHSDMLNISSVFSKLENPLKSSADVFSTSLDTVYRGLIEITEHLYKKFGDLDDNNKQFVDLLNNIAVKNDLIINKLSINDETQNKKLNILSTAVELLIQERHPVKSRFIWFLEMIKIRKKRKKVSGDES